MYELEKILWLKEEIVLKIEDLSSINYRTTIHRLLGNTLIGEINGSN